MDGPGRRVFLEGLPLVAAALTVPAAPGPVRGSQPAPPAPTGGEPWPDWVPRQDPAVVKEVVGVSHRDLARVRELVERQPALANATVDWGFGDWESALGAASHVGQREIAELLIAHGARPSIFSAAMLGQIDVVQAFISASPGVQRTPGPHGLTLLSHAQAGGPPAAAVVQFLQAVGDADRRPATTPLEAVDREAVVGEYAFGTAEGDRFLVDVRNDRLGIERPGQSRVLLFHTGGLVFFPAGVPSVRIAFARVGGRATQLTVANPQVFLTARRR
jgi:hypothetical protein